jgi:ABC-type lipoprotein release transport system permease subunit
MTLAQKIGYSVFNSYNYYINKPSHTITLIASFTLMFLVISIMNQLHGNLHYAWINRFLGGGSIVTHNNTTYDFFSPLKENSYFNVSSFYLNHPGMEKTTSPRIKTFGLLENADREMGALVCGIDFDKETTLNSHINLTGGSLPQPGANEVIMSENLARNLYLNIGDRAIFIVGTVDGYQNYEFVTLSGLLDTGVVSMLYNDLIAYMPIGSLREIMMAESETANEIITFGAVPAFMPLRTGINTCPQNFTHYKAIEKLSLPGMAGIVFLVLQIILTAFFLCFMAQLILSSSVDIIDRRKSEISVFLAYGMTKAQIIVQFILEMVFFVFMVLLIGGLFCVLSVGILNQAHFYAFNQSIEFIFSTVDLQIKIAPLLFLLVSLLFLFVYSICFFALLSFKLRKENLMSILSYAR